MKRHLKMKAAALALAASLGVAADAFAQANEIFIPVLVYRTGAYAPNGVPWADGFVDYLKLVNERDGGVNGVKIAFEECETGYATDRGVECYERLKSKRYRHQAIRRVHIPKEGGKTRPIGVSTIEDKVVQNALREVLEVVLADGSARQFSPAGVQVLATSGVWLGRWPTACSRRCAASHPARSALVSSSSHR